MSDYLTIKNIYDATDYKAFDAINLYGILTFISNPKPTYKGLLKRKIKFLDFKS